MDLWRSLLDQEVFTAGKKAARDSAAFSHKLLNE
jgi:hypothetical protein